jgi:hypothetical protein
MRMRKTFWFSILAFLLFQKVVFATGTTSVTRIMLDQNPFGGSEKVEKVGITWTADASHNAPATLYLRLNGFLRKAVHISSATAPTSGYTITLLDPDSTTLDAAEAAFSSITTSSDQQYYPLVSSYQAPLFASPGLTTGHVGLYGFSVSGNSVNSASATLFLYMCWHP